MQGDEFASPLDEFWFKFLSETKRDPDEKCSGDLNFDSSGFVNDEKVVLIMTGKKTAFFTCYASYSLDNEILPVSGELYIVTDRNNNPRCVIEIEKVIVLPFKEVPWELAKREGEDENLSFWREKQTEYLKDEADILGVPFSENMKVVFQGFRTVYPLNN